MTVGAGSARCSTRSGGAQSPTGTGSPRNGALGGLAGPVAELAHNAAAPLPFFDHDAGREVGPLAVRLAEISHDPAARDRIAEALGERPPA